MYSLMNMFGDLRGIEAIREFIWDGNSELGNSIIPVEYMNMVLQSQKYLFQRWNTALSAEMTEMARSAIIKRIENITDKEIRDINTSELTSLLDTLRLYLSRKSNFKVIEQLELTITKKLLNSK